MRRLFPSISKSNNSTSTNKSNKQEKTSSRDSSSNLTSFNKSNNNNNTHNESGHRRTSGDGGGGGGGGITLLSNNIHKGGSVITTPETTRISSTGSTTTPVSPFSSWIGGGGGASSSTSSSRHHRRRQRSKSSSKHRRRFYSSLVDSPNHEDSTTSLLYDQFDPVENTNSFLEPLNNSDINHDYSFFNSSIDTMTEPTTTSAISRTTGGVGMATANHVYIMSDEYGWIPARVVRVAENTSSNTNTNNNNNNTTITVSVPIFTDEQMIQSDGGKFVQQYEEQTVQLNKYPNQQLPLQNVNEDGILQPLQDMVELPFLHEAAILYNLKFRHKKKLPYTRTGDIIIAVNPYQWLNHLYSESMRHQYASKLVWQGNNNTSDEGIFDARAGLEPHVYETSSLAYRGLAIEGEDQSILVSGESGAGKTETVKILLSDIASVQRGANASHDNENVYQSPIVQRVLDSNPLLEAFGNAKTVRNDNSSRFGKYIQLQFHCEDPIQAACLGKAVPSCVLAGSKCEVYLLEKSRVVTHTEEERTYHIFYQLLAADDTMKTQIWTELENTDNESFTYVGYTATDTIEGMTDEQRFQKTIDSLALVGVKDESFITLMRALCIVLQLGNLIFEPDLSDESKSIISSTQELRDLAELMGVPVDYLLASLTIRTIHAARNEIFKVPLTAETAKESCDAFAKEIYAKAFLWLVRTINDATSAERNYVTDVPIQKYGVIGLLDIFGFESFTVNRFEQLCINYANEKLQQKFTQDVFRSVQAEYEYEGIELGEITYNDNTDVLDLIEGRMGLIAFLNEECLRPGGSDTGFVSKASAMQKDNNCFVRRKGFRPYEFGIQHYAGLVIYDANAFVTKNMDTLPQDMHECARKSTNAILAKELTNESSMNSVVSDHVATVVAQVAAVAAGTAPKKKPPPKRAPTKIPSPSATGKKALGGAAAATTVAANKIGSGGDATLNKKNTGSGSVTGETVWTKFKNQLSSLMTNLQKTRTRYIRCIKPNTMKLPFIMSHLSTIEQLRCAGVVAAVTISRSAFPNRLPHNTVLDRFKALWHKGEHEDELKSMGDTVSFEERSMRLVGRMLTTALKKLETTKKDDFGAFVPLKAFVLGKTRTYFRSGALEYIENERVKCLNDWSVRLQTTARTFLARSKYVRRRNMAIRVESIMRMLMAKRNYHNLRSAAIRVQCWHRCILANRLLYTMRRNYKATLIQTHWRMACAITHLKLHRASAITIQKISRGSIQRPKFRAALQERREEAKLENQLAVLQRKLEEAEKRRIEAEARTVEEMKAAQIRAVAEAQAAAAKAAAEVEEQAAARAAAAAAAASVPAPPLPPPPRDLKGQPASTIEEYHDVPVSTVVETKRSEDDDEKGEGFDEAMSALSDPTVDATYEQGAPLGMLASPIQLSRQQQTLMDESGKMLEYLRKEVFKLRSQNHQLRSDFDLLKDNNQRLMDANASAGASFAALNQHAKLLSKANDKLTTELGSYKQQVQRLSVTQVELREELKMKQATYVAEVHSRLQYQKALQRVIDLAQERCRDERLVEEFLRIADYHESQFGDDGGIRATPKKDPKSKDSSADSGLMSSIRSFWS